MSVATHHIDRFWATDWSLTVLLSMLVVYIFFLEPLRPLGGDTASVGTLAFTLILLSGIVTVARSLATAIPFAVIALVAMGVHWARLELFGDAWIGKDAIASLVACGMLAAIVLSQVFRAGPITSQRIQGALAAYLLIALMFAAAYTWIDLQSPNAFGGAPVGGADANPLERFAYFSFSTLTTVGYGDIVPVDRFARSIAMLEAVIGQIFPAILLARLVSLEIYYRQLEREPAPQRRS